MYSSLVTSKRFLLIVNSEIPLTQEAREVGRIIRKEEPTGSPEKRTDGLQVKERQREGNQGKGKGNQRKGNGGLRQGNGECAIMEVEEGAQLRNYLSRLYPLETRVRGYESLREQICVCTSVRSFYFHN